MVEGIHGDSILDIIGAKGRQELGIDSPSLGLRFSFHRKTKNAPTVDFNELPFMGRDSGDIYRQLTKGADTKLMSEGLTEIFVDTKGETQVRINRRLRNDDPFGRGVLDRHLCTGFDITGHIERLEEELSEIRETPLHVHEDKCKALLERFLVSSREAGRAVTSADEVFFTFRCPGRKQNLTPVDEDKPYLTVPLPLAHGSMSYDFFVAWTRVFNSGYRTLVDHYFFAMAQRVFGRNAGIVPQTFRLPSARSFEQ